jgi:hypothetical protein
MAKGKAEGEAKGKRGVLFMLLDRAGFTLTSGQRQEIDSCDDLARLDRWIESALSGDPRDLFASEPK